MTLVSEIIREAYRECNLIAISGSPTSAEMTEGLYLLNRYISSIYGTDMGEQLDEMAVGRNNIERPQGWPWYDTVPDQTQWFVPKNTRLMLNMTQPQDVWLIPIPDDGTRFAFNDMSNNLDTMPLTVHGNGRLIDGLEQITYNTPGEIREFVYRSDTGQWNTVSPLALDSVMPFPQEFDTLFSIGLAMRLNPRHATEADPQSTVAYNRALRLFRARYRQEIIVASEPALIRTPGSKRRYFENTRFGNSLFNSGWGSPFWGWPSW